MDDKILEEIYQERLEERLIDHIAQKHGIDYKTAMDIYYRSELSEKIHEGRYGVQYLDHVVLAEILEKTEPHLFENISKHS